MGKVLQTNRLTIGERIRFIRRACKPLRLTYNLRSRLETKQIQMQALINRTPQKQKSPQKKRQQKTPTQPKRITKKSNGRSPLQDILNADAKQAETSKRQLFNQSVAKVQEIHSHRIDPTGPVINVNPICQLQKHKYQIDHGTKLGSGQFGSVYAGINLHNGQEVAVKELSTSKGIVLETIRTEVSMLSHIDHHGIIKLIDKYEVKDKVFLMMERMNGGDMLTKIMSQIRLDEHSAKFLMHQILSAVRYLHRKSIVHCDLKPENILLSHRSNFPWAKICDFGYARVISNGHFSKGLIGTVAYLAPEVLQKKCYNRSVDMWAIGVILYVTLSGTFPFNEGDDISDQLNNRHFMFPADPWREISPLSVNLILSLLRIEMNKRLSIEQCIAHAWFKDYKLVNDLHIMLCQQFKHSFCPTCSLRNNYV